MAGTLTQAAQGLANFLVVNNSYIKSVLRIMKLIETGSKFNVHIGVKLGENAAYEAPAKLAPSAGSYKADMLKGHRPRPGRQASANPEMISRLHILLGGIIEH